MAKIKHSFSKRKLNMERNLVGNNLKNGCD